MTLLGKKYISTDTDDTKGYTLPVIVSKKLDEISMTKSLFLSLILHPITIFIVWLIFIVLAILGIYLPTLERPTSVNRDIEFVLVDKEEMPINKKTPYRADINSRAGGKHDPKKPVSMPSPQPAKAVKKVASSPASDLQKMIKQQQKQVVQQQKQLVQQPQKQQQKAQTAQTPSSNVNAPLPQKVVQQPKQVEAPKALAPRPASTPSAPKIAQAPKSNFQVPTPKVAAPKVGPAQGGPVVGTSEGTRVASSGGSSGSGKGTAAPSFAPAKNAYGTSGSSGSSYGGQGRFSGGSSGGGYGSAGNPGPGNPNGRPGIDTLREADFGPYMKELQRRIKTNWDPPKGNESKRVVLLFSISRDGRLLNVKVSKSSGVPAADRAAINAVQLTAPFKPLPSEFKGQKVDIQFTFDYNVYGINSYY